MIEIKDIRTWDNGGKTFTVSIDGTDIKSCRVAKGSKGPFVSGPSQKGKDGKYYNLVWFDNDHQKEILALYEQITNVEVNDGDVPF